MRTHAGAVAGLAAVLTLTLAACGGSDQGDNGGPVGGAPVRIGLIAQEEELIAYPEMAAGAKAAVAYVNEEQNGVAGRPLALDVCSAGDTPESAIKCAQQFANDDSIRLVLVGTLNSVAANPVLVDADKAVLTISNDPADQTTAGVWSFDPGAIVLAAGLLKFAAENLDAKTYSLLVPDDPFYTQTVIPLVEALGANYGIAPAGKAVTVPLDGDPTGAVTQAVDQKGDVLIVVANGPQCIPVAESVNALDVTSPVVAADTCLVKDAIQSGKLDGWYAISVNEAPVDPSLRDDDSYAKIVDEYGNGDESLNSSFGGWAVANVLVAADVLTKAGPDATTEQLNAVLGDAYEIELPTYPPASCPGPGKWTGACVRATTIVKLEDGNAAPETVVDIDMNDLNFLLGG